MASEELRKGEGLETVLGLLAVIIAGIILVLAKPALVGDRYLSPFEAIGFIVVWIGIVWIEAVIWSLVIEEFAAIIRNEIKKQEKGGKNK